MNIKKYSYLEIKIYLQFYFLFIIFKFVISNNSFFGRVIIIIILKKKETDTKIENSPYTINIK